MDEILNIIKKAFNSKVLIQQKRPGIYQLALPLFHEDGDMIDLFLVPGADGTKKYTLCDYGQTLLRLSYEYDIDTPNKESILQKIIKENHLSEKDGNICMETSPETIFPDIMHVTQAYAKIGSMRYFKREVVESLFYEALGDFIETDLKEFNPVKNILPMQNRDDLEVDYQLTPNGHPIYLFGVKDSTKAKLATISCLEFQKADINFRGWIVNEDFEKLPKNDRTRLTNVCDKQFTSLDEFRSSARSFLDRERSGGR